MNMERLHDSSDIDTRAEDESDIDIMRRAVQRSNDEPRATSTSAIASPSAVSFLTDDEDEDFAYEKLNHGAVTFPQFDAIRRSGQLCDVRIVVDGSTFSAHRVVLAATVPYFKAMFTSHMRESMQEEVHISGGGITHADGTVETMDSETMSSLLQYAYTGKLHITVHNVQKLMLGAAYLSLYDIVNACDKYLQQRLQASNVLTIRAFAIMLNSHGLIRASDRFIQKHFVQIAKTDEFLHLPVDDLINILSRDELHVSNEEQVFEAAMRWLSYNEESRCESRAHVLKHVRLPLLKPSYLTDFVTADPRLRHDLHCRDLVDEAKDYHLMPERRALLQTFRVKPRCCNDVAGMIYAVGGLTNMGDSMSTVEMYDPLISKWTVVEPMSTLRSRVGVTVMNGQLYAIGGFNGYERLRTVEVFDTQSRKWKEVTPLNNKRSALGACVVADRVYVCGGYDGITSLNTVECYDVKTRQWMMMPRMQRQRSAAGIAVLDQYIYVMGGHDGMSIFNSVERFDTNTGRWESMPQMLSRRCRLGACALNGKIYACGGYDGSQFLNTVECFDPESETWSHLAPMSLRRSRVSLVANCGRLHAIGGYDGNTNLSSMEIYSPDDDTWRFGASLIAHEGGVGIGVIPTGASAFTSYPDARDAVVRD